VERHVFHGVAVRDGGQATLENVRVAKVQITHIKSRSSCRCTAGDSGHVCDACGCQVKDGLEEAELAATWNQRKRVCVMHAAAAMLSAAVTRVTEPLTSLQPALLQLLSAAVADNRCCRQLSAAPTAITPDPTATTARREGWPS
jgi:hypothetical protein